MSTQPSANQKKKKHHKHSIQAVHVELIYHAFLVVGAYLIIFGFAIGLEKLLYLLVDSALIKDGSPMSMALFFGKYVLLISDCTIFVALIVKVTIRAIDKL